MEGQYSFTETNGERVKVCQAFNEDTILLLETFPEEVWLHILDTIWEPETLFNLSEAALFWRRLLHSRRRHYLLPQVLEVLTGVDYISHENKNEILKWRRVSKSWKSAVNMLLEKWFDVSRKKFQKHEYLLRSNYQIVSMHFGLYSSYNLNWLPTYLQNKSEKPEEGCKRNLLLHSPLNIFPTRHLFIQQEIIEEVFSRFGATTGLYKSHDLGETSLLAAIYFLETVGHLFWHATFNRHAAALLSNLKSLQVFFPWSEVQCGSAAVVSKRAFPTVCNVQLVKFYNFSCPCAKRMLAAVLRSNPHIKMLVLIFANWTGFELPVLISLHTLSVELEDATKTFHLPQLPSLRMLRLGFPKKEIVNCSTILRNLEMYRETLTELCLSLPCPCMPNSGKNRFLIAYFRKCQLKRMNLPNVKSLELSIRSCCSLDLLLGLQSLECLRLCIVLGCNHEIPVRYVGLPTSADIIKLCYHHRDE